MNTCIEKRRGKTVASAFGFDKVHSIDRLMIFSESKSYWYFGIKTSNIFDVKWLHFHIGASIWIKKGIERSHIPDVVNQGRMKWRNCRLSTKTPDYHLGWTVLALCRQLDIRKHNFFM